jgi:hypothetical protein
LWAGLTGLRWILDVFAKLRAKNQSIEGFFEFLRDGYRVIELSCLANRGGRYVEISEYHSGTHRGSVRIPEGRRGAGWSLFEFQVRKFFLGEITPELVTQAMPSQNRDAGVTAVGLRGPELVSRQPFWQAQKLRSNKSPPDTKPKITLTKSRERFPKARVRLAKNEPRPTRITKFVWRPVSKTIRISVDNGNRNVKWVRLGSNTGPHIGLQNLSLVKDQMNLDVGPDEVEAQLIDKNPMDTPHQKTLESSTDDSSCEDERGDVGWSREEPGSDDGGPEAPMRGVLALLAAPTDEMVGEISGSVSPTSLRNAQAQEKPVTVEHAEEELVRPLVNQTLGAQSQGGDLPSELPVTTQTGEVGVEHDTGVPSVEVPIPITSLVDAFEEPRCAEVVRPESSFVTDLALTVMTQCEAKPIAPLTCEPLAVVAPPNVSVAPRKLHSLDRSTWVNTQYKGICELMGFPLESHEQQCLALLRRIEAARFIKKGEVGSRKMVVSGTKGARELRNLVSSVNYEGRQRVSC